MILTFCYGIKFNYQQAKAFDKKTSVLQYLVKLVVANDKELIDFKNDVSKTTEAEGVLIDALMADLKQLRAELDATTKTTVDEEKRLQEEKAKEMTEKELTVDDISSQKTKVREIHGVKHYNKMEYNLKKSSMKEFIVVAEKNLHDATSRADLMKENFSKVLKYFGEDEKMASTDFFGTINKFKRAFDTSHESVVKQEAARVSATTFIMICCCNCRVIAVSLFAYLPM